MRISREQMWMEIAHIVAKRSTCFRLNVGAIVVINNHLVSTGYNGQEPGAEHCKSICRTGECDTIHAERNALQRMKGVPRIGATSMYVTDSPCMDCALEMVRAAISRVYYRTPYRDLAPLSFLFARGIDVYRVTPSGAIIPHEPEPAAARRGVFDAAT